jgi:cytochrome d ubiquinol oxidase subunit II
LTLDTKDQGDLQNDFRLRAIGSGLALIPVASVVAFAARRGAPDLFHGLTNWWAPWLLVATCLCAVGALAALGWRRFALARIAVAGEATLILVGWSLAQYPNLITPDITVETAQAPEATLRLLVLALAAGALLLFPSLFFLFRLFKADERR